IATHGEGLEDIAYRNGVSIRYSASVGGVMPALETIRQISSGERIRSITGIINGTCNFICDRLAEGVEYDVAVREAQEAGFAEADPTLDLNGTDAAQKLILLAKAAFGLRLPFESINRSGIDSLENPQIEEARLRGNVFRLVASVSSPYVSKGSKLANGALTNVRATGTIEASVKPIEVPISHPFANIRGADNCL